MPIELWTARMERPLSDPEREAILPLLPPDRRERLLRVQEVGKQREPLCAYLILCLALRQKYGWKSIPEVALGRLGKPYFPEHPEVHFNISHSSGAVLVGVSDQEIGVDIERIRPVGQRMMVRLAHVSTEEAFFQNWVRRPSAAATAWAPSCAPSPLSSRGSTIIRWTPSPATPPGSPPAARSCRGSSTAILWTICCENRRPGREWVPCPVFLPGPATGGLRFPTI